MPQLQIWAGLIQQRSHTHSHTPRKYRLDCPTHTTRSCDATPSDNRPSVLSPLRQTSQSSASQRTAELMVLCSWLCSSKVKGKFKSHQNQQLFFTSIFSKTQSDLDAFRSRDFLQIAPNGLSKALLLCYSAYYKECGAKGWENLDIAPRFWFLANLDIGRL